MDKNTLVLKTIHGSHLYGTARLTSDIDMYTVTVDGTTRQKIMTTPNGVELDQQNFNLETYMSMLNKGVPQALEALFSPTATFGEEYGAYLQNFRVNRYRANETYQSTILAQIKLANKNMADETMINKKLRHGLRLILNNETLLQHGRFNPVLSRQQKKTIETIMNSGEALNVLTQYVQR